MIDQATIARLRDLLATSTSGQWGSGCLARDGTCRCPHIFSEGHLGGIGKVYIDNGRLVSDGGNDCPKEDEARANLLLIVESHNVLSELLDEVEKARGWK